MGNRVKLAFYRYSVHYLGFLLSAVCVITHRFALSCLLSAYHRNPLTTVLYSLANWGQTHRPCGSRGAILRRTSSVSGMTSTNTWFSGMCAETRITPSIPSGTGFSNLAR